MDQRGRSSRGYSQGRFRGKDYVYTEAEYRFPISKCGGVLSGVVFVNGTTTNNLAKDLELFESVKAGYGGFTCDGGQVFTNKPDPGFRIWGEIQRILPGGFLDILIWTSSL